jgi:hypothetical protein
MQDAGKCPAVPVPAGPPSCVNEIFANAECARIAENFSANSVISAFEKVLYNAVAKGTASLPA